MFLIGLIAAGVAAGALIVIAVCLTLKWLKNKFNEKMAKKNVNKVAALKIDKLVEECPNVMSLSDLNSDDICMAEIDYDGNLVGDVEFVKDNNFSLDQEVDRLLGREQMVVIES